MNNTIIRNAKRKDLETIVQIYNSTVASRMVTADTEPITVESRIPWFEAHSENHRPIWVVESNNQICGWLSFEPFKTRPAYNQTAEISIYVHEDFRSKGIGRLLLETAMSKVEELGIRTLLGYIFGHNEPSLNLFKKYGFEKWAELPKIAEMDGVERDLIILGKRIW